MNKHLIKTAFTVVAGLSFAAMIGGCVSQNNGVTESRRNTTPDDDTFAAGADRAPTAATSFSFARILIGQGRDRDALYILSRTVREHPDFIPAYNEIGGIYVRSDRLDDALNTVAAGLKQAPNDSVLQNNLGMCYFLKGDHQHALEAFSKAAERVPSNPVYRANRAAALAMLGREKEAESDYRVVLDRHSTRVNLALLAKARAQQAADHHADAQPNEAAGAPKSEAPQPESPKTETPAPVTAAPAAEEHHDAQPAAPAAEEHHDPQPVAAADQEDIGSPDAASVADDADEPADDAATNDTTVIVSQASGAKGNAAPADDDVISPQIRAD